LAVVLATLLIPLVVGSASAAKTTKIDICHLDQVLRTYSLNTISVTSLAKHLAHGDVFPGEGVLDANCQPVPARVFVRAFRNADGQPGYNPAADVLYSELVDTNGNASLDAGDTVRVHAYPTDFSGGTGAVGVPSHVVTSVSTNTLTDVDVLTTSGEFVWARGAEGETYVEVGADPAVDVTVFQDNFIGGSAISQSDRISVVSSSPSQPLIPIVVAKDREADDPWLDIAITP
jgi:hypothetical protein